MYYFDALEKYKYIKKSTDLKVKVKKLREH